MLKKELMQYLRSKRTMRRPKHSSLKHNGLGQIKDAVSIRERPADVEDRAVPGHGEGDLIAGSKNSYIATLVERHTRYVMLAKVPNKDTKSVISALIKQLQKLPLELYKSLTWDRGNVGQTDCSGNTSPKAPTCPCIHRLTSTRSPASSMNVPERHWNLKRQQIDLTRALY